jgi:hypothetical protein
MKQWALSGDKAGSSTTEDANVLINSSALRCGLISLFSNQQIAIASEVPQVFHRNPFHQ